MDAKRRSLGEVYGKVSVAITSTSSPNAIKGALIGFALSAVLVIVVELLNDKVRDADDLESRYGMTAIGVIPDLSVTEGGESYYSRPNQKGGAKK